LFPRDCLFACDNEKSKYLTEVFNCIPEIGSNIKYNNFTEKEMVILKLILDFQTYYYKIFDGPYYNSYLNKHISVCRKFYKALYKQDSEEVQGDE